MRRKLLYLLADKLDTLQPKQFNYSRWVGESWEGKEDLSCGTTACALGWATTIPEFRALGLRLFKGTRETGSRIYLEGEDPSQDSETLTSINAAVSVLDISFIDASYLFLPYNHHRDHTDWRPSPSLPATPNEVAAHIRYYINKCKNLKYRRVER